MVDVTQVLLQAREGDPESERRLIQMIYSELRAMARQQMRSERADHTLQPTALANEAFLRLNGDGGLSFEDRSQFFAAAAQAIRRILIEHARRRSRQKRGGGRTPEELDTQLPAPTPDARLLAVDEALHRLKEVDPVISRIVELRFFAGMTVDEVASALNTSASSIARKWRLARAWLQAELEDLGLAS